MSAAKNRPQRRTSGLSGQSPVTPAAAPPASQPAPAATTRVGKQPEESIATRKSAPAKVAAPKSKYPPKVSFYQDPEDTARVRGALRGVMNQPNAATNMSQFINRAVMREVERLEAEHNGGKPFAPVEAGGVPKGRPMGQ